MQWLTFVSLALNAAFLTAAAAFIHKKGGWSFVKSRLVARGLMRDRVLENLEGAYFSNKSELFALYDVPPNATMFVGDSLTDACAWHELLNDPRALNRGISGDTVNGLLKRLESITRARPARVFLMIGINDVNAGTPVETILVGYREILRRLRDESPETAVTVQSLLPLDTHRWGIQATERIKALNRALSGLAASEGVSYLDLYPAFAIDDRLDPRCTHDGLHLNGEGYRRWRTCLQDRFS